MDRVEESIIRDDYYNNLEKYLKLTYKADNRRLFIEEIIGKYAYNLDKYNLSEEDRNMYIDEMARSLNERLDYLEEVGLRKKDKNKYIEEIEVFLKCISFIFKQMPNTEYFIGILISLGIMIITSIFFL